jgi:hypothetical protein
VRLGQPALRVGKLGAEGGEFFVANLKRVSKKLKLLLF